MSWRDYFSIKSMSVDRQKSGRMEMRDTDRYSLPGMPEDYCTDRHIRLEVVERGINIGIDRGPRASGNRHGDSAEISLTTQDCLILSEWLSTAPERFVETREQALKDRFERAKDDLERFQREHAGQNT